MHDIAVHCSLVVVVVTVAALLFYFIVVLAFMSLYVCSFVCVCAFGCVGVCVSVCQCGEVKNIGMKCFSHHAGAVFCFGFCLSHDLL